MPQHTASISRGKYTYDRVIHICDPIPRRMYGGTLSCAFQLCDSQPLDLASRLPFRHPGNCKGTNTSLKGRVVVFNVHKSIFHGISPALLPRGKGGSDQPELPCIGCNKIGCRSLHAGFVCMPTLCRPRHTFHRALTRSGRSIPKRRLSIDPSTSSNRRRRAREARDNKEDQMAALVRDLTAAARGGIESRYAICENHKLRQRNDPQPICEKV